LACYALDTLLARGSIMLRDALPACLPRETHFAERAMIRQYCLLRPAAICFDATRFSAACYACRCLFSLPMIFHDAADIYFRSLLITPFFKMPTPPHMFFAVAAAL